MWMDDSCVLIIFFFTEKQQKFEKINESEK